jgi:hypothetical protein
MEAVGTKLPQVWRLKFRGGGLWAPPRGLADSAELGAARCTTAGCCIATENCFQTTRNVLVGRNTIKNELSDLYAA